MPDLIKVACLNTGTNDQTWPEKNAVNVYKPIIILCQYLLSNEFHSLFSSMFN